MANDIKWNRGRAGYYTAQISDYVVEVEDMTTAYGDSGWFVWFDGERSDYPRTTRREATALAERQIRDARTR